LFSAPKIHQFCHLGTSIMLPFAFLADRPVFRCGEVMLQNDHGLLINSDEARDQSWSRPQI
jgi:hypothetical protein